MFPVSEDARAKIKIILPHGFPSMSSFRVCGAIPASKRPSFPVKDAMVDIMLEPGIVLGLVKFECA
jgi:hypothetical protein